MRPREKHIRRQIESILDVSPDRRQQVIVQLDYQDDFQHRLYQQASRAVWDELVMPTARSLFRLEPDSLLPRRRARTVAPRSVGLYRLRVAPKDSTAARRQKSVVNLRRLLDSEFGRKSASLAPSPTRSRKSHARRAQRSRGAVALWAADSVALTMERDDLLELAKSDLPIRGVFPNRVVRVPPTRRSDREQLPWEVQESKASSWGLNKIGALAVWGAYGARGAGTRIAVLDTGVDAQHPDLRDSKGKSRVTAFAQFDDQGKQVKGAKPHDSDEHGTHCAGTVAGGNASGRWIGVAPEAEIAAGLVLEGGSGTEAGILAGMGWAIDLGVDAISMSLGGFTLDPYMPETYTRTIVNAYVAGIPVVVAVGNDGSQTAGSPGSDLFALTVGATDHLDRAAGFSGGRTLVVERSDYVDSIYLPMPYSKPDLSAPGVDILSATPASSWDVFSGTSMATPHAAGAIALLLSATSIRAKTQGADRTRLVNQILASSCQELGESGQNHRFGWGRIDVLRAIGFAKDAGY